GRSMVHVPRAIYTLAAQPRQELLSRLRCCLLEFREPGGNNDSRGAALRRCNHLQRWQDEHTRHLGLESMREIYRQPNALVAGGGRIDMDEDGLEGHAGSP